MESATAVHKAQLPCRQLVRTATESRRNEIYPPCGGGSEKSAFATGKGGNLQSLSTIALSLSEMAGCCFPATEVLIVENRQRY